MRGGHPGGPRGGREGLGGAAGRVEEGGVSMLAASLRGVPVFGYAATRIKKSLTGSGKAPKEQMQHAIRMELGLDTLPEPHDVADACAVALCHFQIARNGRGLGSSA